MIHFIQAGKTHGFKEATIRQIYMQCITVKIIVVCFNSIQKKTFQPEICGKKGATNKKIGAKVEMVKKDHKHIKLPKNTIFF